MCLELENFAAHVDGDLLRQSPFATRSSPRRCWTWASGCWPSSDRVVRSFSAGDAEHVGLAAEAAVGADLARDARHSPAKALSWSTIV